MADAPSVKSDVINWRNRLLTYISDIQEKVDIFDTETIGDIVRIRHSFTNFLANTGFEKWTGSAPDTWWTAGDAVTSQVATIGQGTWSCQVEFNGVTPAAGNALGNTAANATPYVWYTVTFYYKKVSGTGEVWASLSENVSPYTVIGHMVLDGTVDGTVRLGGVSAMVPAGFSGGINFVFATADANPSKFVFDEVMFQEGKNVSTTWVPHVLDY
jgi:hypothetical protein